MKKRILFAALACSATFACAGAVAQIERPPAVPRFASGDSAVVSGVVIFDRVVYLPVTLNGEGPFVFVLDTGAGQLCAVDETKAAELGLRPRPIGEGEGAGEEAVSFGLLDSLTIALPSLSFENRPMLTVPLSRLDPHWGKRKDGLLGGDVLAALVTRIDYAREEVTFYDASRGYRGPGERIEVVKLGNYLLVPSTILLHGSDVPIEGTLLLDTGVRVTTFNAPFSAKHALAARSPKTVSGVAGFGIGGLSKGVFGRVRGIAIGPFSVREPVVVFSTDRAGVCADSTFSGILGADILSRFTLVLDYARSRIFLEPNSLFEAPFEFDMAGIRFSHEGERFDTHIVFSIFEGSPAAEAGIEPGDILERIDGRDASTFTREDLREYLQGEGRSVRLSIRRGDEHREIVIRLRRLV